MKEKKEKFCCPLCRVPLPLPLPLPVPLPASASASAGKVIAHKE